MPHAGGRRESGGFGILGVDLGFGVGATTGAPTGPSIAHIGQFAQAEQLRREIQSAEDAERARRDELERERAPLPPTPTTRPGARQDLFLSALELFAKLFGGFFGKSPSAPRTQQINFPQFPQINFPQFPGFPFPSASGPGAGGVGGSGSMPNISTSFLGDAGGFDRLIQGGIDILSTLTRQPPSALPGGAPLFGEGFRLPNLGFDLPMVDIVRQGATCITPRATSGMRLPSRVDVPTQDSAGNVRFTTFKNMGRPVLWTGDFAAAKRVRKVAGRARRASGGRR